MTGTQPNEGNREQFLDTQAPIGLPWRLSMFSVILFALALFTYVGLRFGYRAYLNSQAENVDAELEGLVAQVSADDQDQFITLYSQIANLKSVLDKHQFTANALPFLERTVVPGTVFTSANFDAATFTLKLEGTAPSFEALAGQMAVFEKAPEAHSVGLDGVTLSGGTVLFTVNINFKSESFIRQTL